MDDFTKLSDDELFRMAGVEKGKTSDTDYTKMSEDELFRMAGVERPKTNKSLSGAITRGTETAATGLGDIVAEAGKHIGGGKTFPKWMATVARYLHDDSYKPGMEDVTDPNASLGDRAGGVVRAIAEGAPSLALSGAAGLGGGLPGFLAAQTILNGGNAVHNVRQADQVPEDQALDAKQLARVAAITGVDTGLNAVGVGKAVAPAATELGKAGVKALGRQVADAAATNAGVNAAQTLADTALAEGRLATTPELLGSAAVGGVAGGGARALKAIPELPAATRADRFSRFANYDPERLQAAAEGLTDSTGAYGKISEGNAEDIRTKATAAARDTLGLRSKDNLNKGPNLIEAALDAEVRSGNVGPQEAYTRAMSAVKRGEPVNAKDLDALKGVLGGEETGAQWLKSLEEASILGELGNMGVAKGDGRMGGIHATKLGQRLENLGSYFGMGSLAASVPAAVMGHGSLSEIGVALGIGGMASSGLMRGIDKLTGYDNPVGNFERMFKDPTTYSQPARNIASTIQSPLSQKLAALKANQDPNQTPPPIPVVPPDIPSEGVQKWGSMIDDRFGFPGPALGEDITAPPTRSLPLGADAKWRAYPVYEGDPLSLAKLDALISEKTDKNLTQAQPSAAFLARKAAAASKAAAAQAGREKVNGGRKVIPAEGEMFPGVSILEPSGEVPLSEVRARRAALMKAKALTIAKEPPPAPKAPPESLAKRAESERLRTKLDQQPEEVVAPPMEEAIKGRKKPETAAPTAAPMEAAVKAEPNWQYMKVGKGQHAIRYDANRVENLAAFKAGAEERIMRREKFVDHMKTIIPKHADALDTFLREKWVDKGDKRSALGELRAHEELTKFLRSKRVSPTKIEQIMEDIKKPKIGIPTKNWNAKE